MQINKAFIDQLNKQQEQQNSSMFKLPYFMERSSKEENLPQGSSMAKLRNFMERSEQADSAVLFH